MSVWCPPVERRPETTRCEICEHEIEQLIHSGRFMRICRSCLVRRPEKRAA